MSEPNTSASSKASSDASSLNASSTLGAKSSLDTNSTINSTILNPATSSNASNEPYRLDATVITANAFAFQSGEVIGTEQLATIPNGNGDITSVLKILPNVQFDNNQMNSNTPGEIDPANVSISGGLYYQNSFLLDGKSMNNDLSGGVGKTGQNADFTPGEQREFSGRSQGLNVDTFLLKSIKVQDSNIGAAYGGFTGGVIEAETKEAEKDFGANIAYQISQGNANDGSFSLTRYHIYGNEQDFLNSDLGNKQPKFIKHSFRSSLESKVNDKLGIIASFTTTQSIIPRRGYSGEQARQEEKKEKRQSYNFFVKGNYQASDKVALEASYGYMPQFNTYINQDWKDSDTTIRSGGHQLGLDSTVENSLGFFTATSSFSYLQESRRSDAVGNKTWLYSADKNWGNVDDGSMEGSFGDEDNKQSDLSLKLTQNFEPYYNDIFESGFNIGTELSYTHAYFKRLKDSYDAAGAMPLVDQNSAWGDGVHDNSQVVCRDTQWCSNTKLDENDPIYTWGPNNGQFITSMTEYKAGEVAMDNTALGFFLENESKFDLGNKGDIATRLGLRMDYDTYMQKSPIAPRFSANYTAPWGKDEFKFGTQFTFGANRYYGRNLYAYKLNEKKAQLQTSYIRMDATKDWSELPEAASCDPNDLSCPSNSKVTGTNDFDFRQLKVPYDDELMFGIMQEIGLFNVSSKYIHRFGRDQVRRMCAEYDTSGNCVGIYTYNNSDKSDTDVITLSIGNNTPFMLNSVSNYFNFAFDYTKIQRSFNDFNEISDPSANDWIIYKGQLQRKADLDVSNFAQPLTFRFSTTHGFKLLGTDMTLNNFFRVRMPYNTTAEVDGSGNGTQTNPFIYEDYRVATRFTWDLRLGIEKQVYKKNTLYANIDVYNVLDKVNITVLNNSKGNPSPTYEIGRQFWLEVGYRY